MSNLQNSRLYDLFISELDTIIACPYCGTENQLDGPILCCSELHAQLYYIIDGDLVEPENLESHYEAWLEKRENAEPQSQDDKYFSSYKDYDNND